MGYWYALFVMVKPRYCSMIMESVREDALFCDIGRKLSGVILRYVNLSILISVSVLQLLHLLNKLRSCNLKKKRNTCKSYDIKVW